MGLDFALRCAAAGHAVRLYRHMPKKPERVGEGFKEITLVDDWRASMAWAKEGLVVLTGNFTLLHEMQRYREFGYPVFAPTPQSARLEIERMAGIEAARAAGINVPEYHEFSGLEEAEAFARKSDQAFVFKPGGDEENKALTYVADDPADLCGWLRRQIKAGKKLKRCLLQEKIDLLAEIGVSGWCGPEGFLPDKWQICFEHKKLMPGEKGPNTGEAGCYSADSEVLTGDGWKFWPDVTEEDALATLVDGVLTFEVPSVVVQYDFDGPMIQWNNRSIDILVTPNHNMYVAGQASARQGRANFKFVSALDCSESQYLLTRTAGWSGTSPDMFVAQGHSWNTGIGFRKAEDVSVPFPAWARFLGVWFAEGSTRREQCVQIAQSHPYKAAKIEEIIASTGLPYRRRENGFDIGCAAVARHLRPLGRSYEKRVPDYIKNASPTDIAGFLDGFAIGDAHTKANGSRAFYTSNPGLADDIQELMLRCGRLGIIKRRKDKTVFGKINGRIITPRRQAYVVYERVRKRSSWLDIRDRREVRYTGKVYCATVSSHILFVRRNGKPVWCGNTVCQYVEADKLADEVLRPMEPVVRALGHRGDFAFGGAIDSKGKPWFFEWTARFGYPAWWIQMASHRGDPAKWMRDLLDGKDSLRVSYDVAIGVVCGQPRYPYNASPPELVEGNPIFGVDDAKDRVHLASVMLGTGPRMEGGKIASGPQYQTTGEYVLVCTGLGKTVERARERVYRAVDRVRFPDKIVRDDIGCKVIEALPKLHGFGYAADMA